MKTKINHKSYDYIKEPRPGLFPVKIAYAMSINKKPEQIFQCI